MLLKMNGKVNDRRSLINYELQWNCDWFTLFKLQFSLISYYSSNFQDYLITFFFHYQLSNQISHKRGLKLVNFKFIILQIQAFSYQISQFVNLCNCE